MDKTAVIIGFIIVIAIWRLAAVWSRGHRARKCFQEGLQALDAHAWETAEGAFGKAVRLQPISAVARRLYAAALSQQGKLERAEEELRMATALEPRNPDGYADLGYFLATRVPERTGEAIEVFGHAVKLAPQLRATLAQAHQLAPLRADERFRRLLDAEE